MGNIAIDSASRAIPGAATLGYAQNVTGKVSSSLRGLVRLHASAEATIKLAVGGGDGVTIGAGETTFLVLPDDVDVEVVGTVNLMVCK